MMSEAGPNISSSSTSLDSKVAKSVSKMTGAGAFSSSPALPSPATLTPACERSFSVAFNHAPAIPSVSMV